MIDHETLQRLSYALQKGISNGMRDGTEHIAAALAKQPAPGASMTFEGGVTGAQLAAACKVLAVTYTETRRTGSFLLLNDVAVYAPNVGNVRDAWVVLRRALGMPT